MTQTYITILRNDQPTGITYDYDAKGEAAALAQAKAAADAWRLTQYTVVGWRGPVPGLFKDGEQIPLPSAQPINPTTEKDDTQ